MATKFIKISTSEEIPEHGTYVVEDYEGRILLTRFNKFSTEEFFKSNYKFWMKEVPDVEVELKETLKETHSLLEKSIQSFTEAKEKIEYYQKQLNKIRNDQSEIELPKDIDK